MGAVQIDYAVIDRAIYVDHRDINLQWIGDRTFLS
jgi:hypothetical protein